MADHAHSAPGALFASGSAPPVWPIAAPRKVLEGA